MPKFNFKMKNSILILFLFWFNSSSLSAQETPTEDLPLATINNAYTITLDETKPLAEYYKVDLSNLTFKDEAQVKKDMRTFVSGNLISNEVYFEKQFMIIRIHTEYLNSSMGLMEVQTYLNQKRRSLK